MNEINQIKNYIDNLKNQIVSFDLTIDILNQNAMKICQEIISIFGIIDEDYAIQKLMELPEDQELQSSGANSVFPLSPLKQTLENLRGELLCRSKKKQRIISKISDLNLIKDGFECIPSSIIPYPTFLEAPLFFASPVLASDPIKPEEPHENISLSEPPVSQTSVSVLPSQQDSDIDVLFAEMNQELNQCPIFDFDAQDVVVQRHCPDVYF